MSPRLDRRRFLAAAGAATTLLLTPWDRLAFAKELTRTPAQTAGPFYPDRLPVDRDSDLIIVRPSITPAVGTITQLTGDVRDVNGAPVRGAVVEIWQTDSRGSYLHSRGANGRRGRDPHFQGFGRATTDTRGRYTFRTIAPVAYPGRTPHIHVTIRKGRRHLLTTQLYRAGDKRNARDGLYRAIRSTAERQLVTIPFTRVEGSKIGELAAHAPIIVGLTPADR